MSEEIYMTRNISDKDKEASLPRIIAVDFDGTLVSNRFPEIGEIDPVMWDEIIKEKIAGTKIILWTSRTDEYLDKAVRFCAEHGLIFDAVNDNIAECKALGWNARKVFANLYIDDRNGRLFLGRNKNLFESSPLYYVQSVNMDTYRVMQHGT